MTTPSVSFMNVVLIAVLSGCGSNGHHPPPQPELSRRPYRRVRNKLGAPKAATAMAHKFARLVDRMLNWGHEYVDKGLHDPGRRTALFALF